MKTPIGGIIMWSGDLAAIPAGWYLCDGAAHDGLTTPDLRGKFIYGASADANVGANSALNAHAHARPANVNLAGAHSHSWSISAGGSTGSADSAVAGSAGQDIAQINHTHGSAGGTVSEADHTHSLGGNTDSAGVTPPYLMLYFIMRTA